MKKILFTLLFVPLISIAEGVWKEIPPPPGLEDCKMIKLVNNGKTEIIVVRCPTMTTTATKF